MSRIASAPTRSVIFTVNRPDARTTASNRFQRELERCVSPLHTFSVWLLIILNLAGKAAALGVCLTSPAAALGLWFLPDALLAYHLFHPRAQGLVRSCSRFKTLQREVWLTIDDGPDPFDTPRILELLRLHQARATFFVIGKNAAAHPELMRAIRDAGHEVGHHTQTHPARSFWCASPGRVARELDAGLAVLETGGPAITRFRPPVGIKNIWLSQALSKRKLGCVGWSARGLELHGGDADTVASRVLNDLQPGGILLLHEGPRLPPTIRVEAIRKTLERLKQLDYQCIVPQSDQLIGT